MTQCKIKKECPNCKKKMSILTQGLTGDYINEQVCNNNKCKFYGIVRFCAGTSSGD